MGEENELTMSNVLAARSLTKGRAMRGIRFEAEMWPWWLLTSNADMIHESEPASLRM